MTTSMRAAWYMTQGPAHDVLRVGDQPLPVPGPGEVRVRVAFSGVNPGDTKKRTGWEGSTMESPLVIPHSDAAGVIDAVGDGVDPARVGRRVWVLLAQSYRWQGTAAQYTVVPDWMAPALPAGASDQVGACLGIPGVTAHRAVFADGDVARRTLLVHGVLGSVGSLAAQLARRAGARVIGTVTKDSDVAAVDPRVADDVVSLASGPVAAIKRLAPDGVDRIVEVAFFDNIDLDQQVGRQGTVIAAYATHRDSGPIPFWPLLFDNAVIRLLGSDDFPHEAKTAAVRDLTAAAPALFIPIARIFGLEDIADAHEYVDHAHPRGRVLVAVD